MHLLNASSPIVLTVLGIVIVLKSDKKKALSSIVSIPSGITKSKVELQPQKAPFPIIAELHLLKSTYIDAPDDQAPPPLPTSSVSTPFSKLEYT